MEQGGDRELVALGEPRQAPIRSAACGRRGRGGGSARTARPTAGPARRRSRRSSRPRGDRLRRRRREDSTASGTLADAAGRAVAVVGGAHDGDRERGVATRPPRSSRRPRPGARSRSITRPRDSTRAGRAVTRSNASASRPAAAAEPASALRGPVLLVCRCGAHGFRCTPARGCAGATGGFNPSSADQGQRFSPTSSWRGLIFIRGSPLLA